jgi:hypothetical protein
MAYSKQQAIESIVASLFNYHKFGTMSDLYKPQETWEARRQRRQETLQTMVPNTLLLEGSFVDEAWSVLDQGDEPILGIRQWTNPDATKIIAELEHTEPQVFHVTPGFVIFSSHLDG